jgi:ATP-dependent metalloprotease FtsH
MFGYREGIERGVFSIEDYDTEGISCFDLLREKMPHIPVYMLETDKRIREVDKSTFQQLGAYGVLRCIEEEGYNAEVALMELLTSTYLQEKVNELARQEKVLQYDTAQMISENGESAVIEFYDFKLHTAVKADSKGMVLTDAEKPNVKFDDVIGAQNAKDELNFFIKYLKNPKEFMMRGVKAPKGILLYGPPGTGKTMLAKAMAGEADVTFLATSSTDFARPYVGEGEAAIRKLFSTAKQYAPSVIFIDEIDAIAKERTGSSSTHHTEKLLNTLLTEMDGFSFDPHRPVFVMAATNFPIEKGSDGRTSIDPALLRRFANKIYVDLPNEEERKEFLQKRIRGLANCELSEEALANIASRSTGESLANLQNVLDLAMRNAEKAGKPLTDDFLLNAMEEYFYGEEHKWGREYFECVAHHEAGHAYIAHLSGKKAAFVTIVSRGDFGGYMQPSADDKTPSYSKQDLLWKIRTSLAGRAAELVFFGEEVGTNTGVSSDLEHATNIAFQMICRYGMAGGSLLSIPAERLLSSPAGLQIMEQAQSILEEEMQTTIRLIEEGREKMQLLASKLLEKNQLMANEIEDILNA